MRKSLKQPVPKERSSTVSSAVAIRQHPLHPMLVVYPIACLSLLPVSDLALLWTGTPFWGQVSLLLNMVGLGGGLVAAIVGTCDMLLIRVARRHVSVWSHAIAAVMLLAVSAAGVRLRMADAVEAVWPWGLMLSVTGLLLVGVAGWLGGTLTFKYGIGVYGNASEEEEGGDGTPPAA
ncbi:DUF2231 domain-containing protein [Xanthomonas sp. XNM01]|uniref:DUF2231 domain-containing protein n=1 Tax=Xanthomonas sp. XNM01 TaxID=2769289 RepID=UPI00178373B4|nr:DUF2231 domain-containing protein [Xanthomonas sp. XNM01]MBD9368162.1 DUF2231 domain-containing protein [Xanthomonas sp. XNM01]